MNDPRAGVVKAVSKGGEGCTTTEQSDADPEGTMSARAKTLGSSTGGGTSGEGVGSAN